MPKQITEEISADAALQLTREIIEKHPVRKTGTPQGLEAAHTIAAAMRDFCTSVTEESFDLHPGSLWNVGRVLAISYCISGLLLIFLKSFVYAALVVSLFGFVYGIVHFVLFGRLFDFLFPRAKGCNVAGVVDPEGKTTQQILIVGHHDSPYCFSFLMKFQKWASVRLLLAILFYVFLLVLCVAGTMESLWNVGWQPSQTFTTIALAAGLLFVVPLYFLITRIPSPGASDNLNSCSIAMKLAEFFTPNGGYGSALAHTRIVALSTDGEEAGERGATAYAERHKSELLGLPTFVLVVESICRLQDLVVLTRDRNCTLGLSRRMAHDVSEVASGLGYNVREKALPFGGGGTDAIAFGRLGVETTAFLGLPTALIIKKNLVYHTPEDTPENIDRSAVEAIMKIAANYIVRKDAEAPDSPA